MPETKQVPNQRVTIRHVAESAGVSVSAVSKVLRNAYGVSKAMRDRVSTAIKRLNYRPLPGARGMRGQTYSLGVVLPDIRNPFFADILRGFAAELRTTEYQPILGVLEVASSDRGMIESMIDRQVDGIVLVGSTLKAKDLNSIALQIPTVAIGYHRSQATHFDTVNNDDFEGARLAVRHLVSCGFRNIAMFSLKASHSTIVVARENGYRFEMLENGLDESIRIVREVPRSAEILLTGTALLRQLPRRAAVFCWSDLAAFHLKSAAVDLGLAVPADLGIVGYDNSAWCGLTQNSLTSVDQSGLGLGEHAARLLVERIAGRSDAAHILVGPELVARNSTLGERTEQCGPGVKMDRNGAGGA